MWMPWPWPPSVCSAGWPAPDPLVWSAGPEPGGASSKSSGSWPAMTPELNAIGPCAADTGEAPSPCALYFSSQKGVELWTVGTTRKLYSGGGEGMVHSSVPPFHGSGPATRPRFRDQIQFTTSANVDRPRMYAPTVDMTF